MHFSIPDTSEVEDDSGKFTTYNVYTNGAFHCSVRYSQLLEFSEQVKKEFTSEGLPPFPKKRIKFLRLTPAEMEERREMLEKYLQSVSQVPRIAKSNLFTGFLLSAQQEAAQQEAEAVSIDIYLPNGNKQNIDVMSTDQAEDVLEAFCRKIKLREDFVYYFGLFLMKVSENEVEELIRKVQDFESPYISLRDLSEEHRIVLRKWYWDPMYDEDLWMNSIALNLMFVQAVHDVEAGWIRANKHEQRQLSGLKSKKSRKEYMQLVRTLKHYNFVQVLPCKADFPIEGIAATVSLGPSELCLEVATKTGEIKEFNFLVTRMRCWKVVSCGDRLELSFEYLFNKDKLKWVKISGSQAIFISVCLQGLVDELLLKRDNLKFKRPQDRERQQRSLELHKRTVLSTTSHNQPPVENHDETEASSVDDTKLKSDTVDENSPDGDTRERKPSVSDLESESKPADSSYDAPSATNSVSTSDQNGAAAVHSSRTTLSQAKNAETLTDRAKNQAKRISTKVSEAFTKQKGYGTPSHMPDGIELDRMEENKVFADIKDEDL